MNTLSSVAKEIVEGTLNGTPLGIPTEFYRVLHEMLEVPEKPISFQPSFTSHEREKIVLVTGGLDSSFGWFATEGKKRAVYFDIGQKYADKELKALDRLKIDFEYLRLLDISNSDKGEWKHIHPGRNFLYITKAAELLNGPGSVVICATDGEMPMRGGDKSFQFFTLCQEILDRYCPYKVNIEIPTIDRTKPDELEYWLVNFSADPLHTVSCFSSYPGNCGECQSCLRRYLAFAFCEIDIGYNYRIHPMIGGKQYVTKYKTLMSKALADGDFSKYSKKRCEQDLFSIAWAENNI